MSAYVRHRVLGKPVSSKMDERIIAELSRLGGLQKACYTALTERAPSNTWTRADTQKLTRVLDDLREAILSIRRR